RLAHEGGVSPSKVLDELAIADGCVIDYDKGLVLCARGQGGASEEDIGELRSALRGIRLEIDALTNEVAAIKHLLDEQERGEIRSPSENGGRCNAGL
ncbi:MAG: hypothetical protein V1737_01330, partial [Chloroflexota bacterium]